MRPFCKLSILILTLIAPAILADPKVVHFTVDPSQDVHPISPYIYGWNSGTKPFNRLGGNRWTAYNWETNASNAGNDWHHQNDGYLSESDTPGAAILPTIEAAAKNRQALLITIPMAGYVAADKKADGDVKQTPDYLHTRFFPSLPKKNGPLALSPDTKDGAVYQDEFVNWIEKNGRRDPKQVIFYALDNEPDLWSETHARIHPDKLTYAELLKRSVDYASGIKGVAPGALVFGPASYGWNGYRTLQNAPDAGERDFLEFYLSEMKNAEKTAGHRLLDVLDVHWYSEATGGGVRVTGKNTSADVIAARVQAPRSLWDPNYSETSWIANDSLHEPIALIPRLKKMIDSFYPGTKLAITEYEYGAGNHISGAIAQADALGIFGQQGIFAAAWWDLGQGSDFVNAAFNMYLNCDGKGSSFGSRSIAAKTDDIESTSIYAALDDKSPDDVNLILINRTDQAIEAQITLPGSTRINSAKIFELSGDNPAIKSVGLQNLSTKTPVSYLLPAYSVNLFRTARK